MHIALDLIKSDHVNQQLGPETLFEKENCIAIPSPFCLDFVTIGCTARHKIFTICTFTATLVRMQWKAVYSQTQVILPYKMCEKAVDYHNEKQ